MSARHAAAITAALLLAAAGAAVNAQPVHAGGPAAATRSVSRYLALERELQQALAAGDAAAVRLRVDEGFEYRTPASEDTRDRDAWLRRAPHAPARIRDLTVREEEGGVAIVSFLADSQGQTRFVVDVWKGERLVARYSALAPEARKAPRRPSGRE